MAEYSLRIYRQFKKFPQQIALYGGEPKLRMNASLVGPDSQFQYTLIDARNSMAASCWPVIVEDNSMAILTRLNDPPGATRQILALIASLEKHAQPDTLEEFLISRE